MNKSFNYKNKRKENYEVIVKEGNRLRVLYCASKQQDLRHGLHNARPRVLHSRYRNRQCNSPWGQENRKELFIEEHAAGGQWCNAFHWSHSSYNGSVPIRTGNSRRRTASRQSIVSVSRVLQTLLALLKTPIRLIAGCTMRWKQRGAGSKLSSGDVWGGGEVPASHHNGGRPADSE